MPLFCFGSWKYRRRGSSVNIDPTTDWTTGVRSPTEAMDFSSSLCVQTSSHSHPASYPMGTGGLFPGVKRGRDMMITTHTHLVPTSRMSRSYTSCPPCYVHDGGRTALLENVQDKLTMKAVVLSDLSNPARFGQNRSRTREFSGQCLVYIYFTKVPKYADVIQCVSVFHSFMILAQGNRVNVKNMTWHEVS
jgi:hypothetical protein